MYDPRIRTRDDHKFQRIIARIANAKDAHYDASWLKRKMDEAQAKGDLRGRR